MKSRNTAAILNHMIDNEVVKFEDETGGIISTVTKHQYGGMYTLTVQSRQGLYIASTFFNRYEEDGEDALRLYWDASIVGMLFTNHIDTEPNSIYS